MENNNMEKSLTLKDLGKFTEEVFLPAIGNIVDARLEVKLEEKLEQKLENNSEVIFLDIMNELFSIRRIIGIIGINLDKFEATRRNLSNKLKLV
jgi:hypothetical protein